MRWKQALGVAAALGALASRPLAAQNEVTFMIVTGVASDTVPEPSAWATQRAQMMRAAEHDLRTLQFDETGSQLFQGTVDHVRIVFRLVSGQAVMSTMEQPKSRNCPKAARQS